MYLFSFPLSSTTLFYGICAPFQYGPRHKKICLQGFQPGPTQTWLYSHRRWLQAWIFGLRSRGIVLYMWENKGTDQLHGYRAADLHLCFSIHAKSRFSHDTALILCISLDLCSTIRCSWNHAVMCGVHVKILLLHCKKTAVRYVFKTLKHKKTKDFLASLANLERTLHFSHGCSSIASLWKIG